MSKKNREIDENSLEDVEKSMWGSAFAIMYEKSLGAFITKKIQEAKTNSAILASTGHTQINQVIDADEIIEKNYEQMCEAARDFADKIIIHYRKTKCRL